MQVHIGELEEHKVGSDNNRFKLGFSMIILERIRERLPSFVRPYLIKDVAATVPDVSEKSDERRDATGSSRYVTVFSGLIRLLSRSQSTNGRRQRKCWWDSKVKTVI